MPRFFLSSGAQDSGFFEIVGDDAKHISFSLRMRIGEHLTVCDGDGTDYDCVISEMDGKTVKATIVKSVLSCTEPPFHIRLYQSVPKGDKLDYIVQKAVELGISEIVPVYSARCIVKPTAAGEEKRLLRLGKIAEEAAKQCGRGKIPRLLPPVSFSDAVRGAQTENTFICYENEDSLSLRRYLEAFCRHEENTVAFFVGPEGGYSKEEIELAASAGIPSVKLGARILRCETASGFVLSCISYAFELK